MNKQRFKAVDSLRFLSIIAIIFYHYTKYLWPGGFLAVDIFFVISGYFLTRSLLRQGHSQESIPILLPFLKRIRKLAFPMLFVMGVCLTGILLFRQDLLVNLGQMFFSSLLFVNNWVQISNGSSYFAEMLHPSLFTHLWYLSVYVQFILFWPILFRFILQKLKNYRWQIYFVLALIALSFISMIVLFQPGQDPTRVYYGTDTRAFTFLIGALMAYIDLPGLLLTYMEDHKWYMIDGLNLMTLTAIIALFKLMTDNGTFTYWGGMLVFDLCVAVFLAGIMQEKSLLGRLFAFKPIVYLGQRSYPMYLWYYPIFILFHMSAQNRNWLTANIGLQVVLIILLGVLTYELIVNKRWTAPVFNQAPGTSVRLFTGLKNVFSKQGPYLEKIVFAFFALIYLCSATALALSPSAENMSVQEKQAQEQQEKMKALNEQRAKQEAELNKGFENYQSQLTDEQKAYQAGLDEKTLKKAFALPVTFIGDSLTVGVSEAIYSVFPQAIVDAQVGRQLYDSQPVVEQLKANQQLADTVVVDLGANGPFTKAQLDEFLAAIGSDKEIYLVNTHVDRPWRDQVNQLLAQAAEEGGDNIHLVDWANYYATNNNNWLGEDGVHFNQAGILAWINFVSQAITQ